jgi:urease accessory protein
MTRRLSTVALAAASLSSPAWAHSGREHAVGFVSGFAHPFGGLDHLLAMILLGVWAGQAGGRAAWLLPLAFVSAMTAAGVLGMAGTGLPAVELGIAGSVVALGLLLALQARTAPVVAVALAAVFAAFHGHAHGTEMPAAADPLLYGAGFVAATALLHGAGIAIAQGLRAASTAAGRTTARGLGLLGAACGIALAAIG